MIVKSYIIFYYCTICPYLFMLYRILLLHLHVATEIDDFDVIVVFRICANNNYFTVKRFDEVIAEIMWCGLFCPTVYSVVLLQTFCKDCKHMQPFSCITSFTNKI